MLGRALAVVIASAACASAAAAQDASLLSQSASHKRPLRNDLTVAPIELATNDGFNLLSFTPPHDGAYLLGPGRALLTARWHVSRMAVGEVTDAYRFRATLNEVRVTGAIGLPDVGVPLELRFGMSFAALTGSERYVDATFRDASVVPTGWAESPAARRGILGLKLHVFQAAEMDLQAAVSGWLKLPIDGDTHLTDSGEPEGGAVLNVSYAFRVGADRTAPPNMFLHLMGGAMLRKSQTALATRVRPNPGAVYGAALLARGDEWPIAMSVQVRGAVNSWQELDGFSSDPVTVQVGLRGWFAEGLMYEAGAGLGLSDTVSAEWSFEFATGWRF